MTKKYAEVWDLGSIFAGGTSGSPAFQQHLHETKEAVSGLEQAVEDVKKAGDERSETWAGLLVRAQEIGKYVREASAFVSCLTAQNVKDEEAKILSGEVKAISAAYQTVMTAIDEQLLAFTDEQWQALTSEPAMAEISYNLNERRERAEEKLPADKEQLIQQLSVDGYQAWGDMYNEIVGRMSVPIDEDGQTKHLSVGQAANKLSDPARDTREHVFQRLEETWGKETDLFANTLNHLAGFRLTTYEARGWSDVLYEPLTINRMQRETLDVMWETITEKKPAFTAYLERKAALLGVDQLAMHDISAPLTDASRTIPFDDAADLIVTQFRKFSPKMADFAQHAFDHAWIEAEDRDGKRPGGFCTTFPLKEESRIFMTYDGSASNVATLAHELGHAYHQTVMNDLPQMAQKYAMNVAETASTFAEMIVADAAVKQAETAEEKIQLLDNKLNRSIAFFMNIHARFLFETRFYEERKQGVVREERLNELMTKAQKEAYCEMLSDYSPTFWASKLHFHITAVPFYNFPYTFGYLFSMGIYRRAADEGAAFENRYIDLLRDTGRMQVEDLAAKHLDADLTGKEFWQQAIDFVKEDVDTFIAMTAEKAAHN
ncbi:M3 family oligoendopeptidase [Salisediminibacterium halotolerans]|uniref:Oligoendopeptidase, pepF/M3 family n=1 Tax=Salisediminibacterium halotolerans TaxID=517425 RepID=A0A1H9WQ55_9BACI|nr:M3 family oligoendopeptidase [Salisediminibacterium haloalkalitolerans]SES35954.1 oligoendopeptidase, pepF/M3 family [Salisediminibacterium haloalkalitolerans]